MGGSLQGLKLNVDRSCFILGGSRNIDDVMSQSSL